MRVDVAQGVGPSGRTGIYEVADDELAVGSTLGGPKIGTILKATGAIEKVWSPELGACLFGSLVLRHYDERTGVYLSSRQPGTFTIHPEHQEHTYRLMDGVLVHECVFVLSGPLEDGRSADPPAVYLDVEIHNSGTGSVRLSTFAFADLRGDTDHDVTATYHASHNALLAWNESRPEWVRLLSCSRKPTSHETTKDFGKAVAQSFPGRLSNRTGVGGDPLGVLQLSYELEPGASTRFTFVMTFSGDGKKGAERALAECPPADEALERTRQHYGEVLRRTVVLTPDEQINRGVLWAKANMLRVEMEAQTGWCFTNDPARSNHSVARDTAWFGMGADYVTPEFSRRALLAYVERQEPSGKIVEYYDVRTGETEDYGLNISDNTPLMILALWHHYITTGDEQFLREVYPSAAKAARHILSQRNEQGLVWCTATGTGAQGIASWRNVIPGYRLTGAVTEVNAECYAALTSASKMARVLGCHAESAEFGREAVALREAINRHLSDPKSGLYYLCLGADGEAHSDVTCDLVFPVMFGVADDRTASRIIGRLTAADFWTDAGMRTVPRDAPDYSPSDAAGLLGGVWVGVSFWYAFAAAPYTPGFMARALSMSFRNYSAEPRSKNTVPGQFSEWLHGETLSNRGMMLSPWFPPRYVWAAVEGMAGVNATDDMLVIEPRLAPEWQWLAVQNLPYRGKGITFFAARTPELLMYSNTVLQRAERARIYEEDISGAVHADGSSICTVGLRQGSGLVVLVGSTDDQTVSTSLRLDLELTGLYSLCAFDSLLGQWKDEGRLPAERLRAGITIEVEHRGFVLLDIRQTA